jgi:hypothetical protein
MEEVVEGDIIDNLPQIFGPLEKLHRNTITVLFADIIIPQTINRFNKKHPHLLINTDKLKNLNRKTTFRKNNLSAQLYENQRRQSMDHLKIILAENTTKAYALSLEAKVKENAQHITAIIDEATKRPKAKTTAIKRPKDWLLDTDSEGDKNFEYESIETDFGYALVNRVDKKERIKTLTYKDIVTKIPRMKEIFDLPMQQTMAKLLINKSFCTPKLRTLKDKEQNDIEVKGDLLNIFNIIDDLMAQDNIPTTPPKVNKKHRLTYSQFNSVALQVLAKLFGVNTSYFEERIGIEFTKNNKKRDIHKFIYKFSRRIFEPPDVNRYIYFKRVLKNFMEVFAPIRLLKLEEKDDCEALKYTVCHPFFSIPFQVLQLLIDLPGYTDIKFYAKTQYTFQWENFIHISEQFIPPTFIYIVMIGLYVFLLDEGMILPHYQLASYIHFVDKLVLIWKRTVKYPTMQAIIRLISPTCVGVTASNIFRWVKCKKNVNLFFKLAQEFANNFWYHGNFK